VRGYLEYVVSSRVAALGTAARLDLLRRVLARGGEWPAHVPSLTVRDVYEGARDRHEPKLVHAPHVVLVKASSASSVKGDTPLSEMYADPLLGWDRYVTGSIETIQAPGGHTSMLKEPWVASLARALERYLPSGPRYGGTIGSRNPA
jgi:thioesterase domain-containing protein